jgi:crotonobetainyl-CoA:carnitine CoA-transferase CaiB-like acyl-CoA transferase
VYWDGVCDAIGRSDLRTDPRFADPDARTANIADAAAELEKTFASRPLADWRVALATQPGQWDVVNNVLELPSDPQAIANRYVQPVAYDDVELPMVSAPAQVDRAAPALKPAPAFNDDADALLGELGLTQDEIIEAKISGALA